MSAQATHCRLHDRPIFTEHALQRWDQRTPPSSVAPETAWQEGQRSTDAARALDADEVRYHNRADALLIRRQIWVTTVYDLAQLEDDQLYLQIRKDFTSPTGVRYD